jgi:hypothetical protein
MVTERIEIVQQKLFTTIKCVIAKIPYSVIMQTIFDMLAFQAQNLCYDFLTVGIHVEPSWRGVKIKRFWDGRRGVLSLAKVKRRLWDVRRCDFR